MAKVPRPLDEANSPSHVGSLCGPISRIRDAYGWAAESFASDRYRAADHPAWRRRMLDRVFEAMRYRPAKGTAGFALSAERMESRSPAPPARIIASTRCIVFSILEHSRT